MLGSTIWEKDARMFPLKVTAVVPHGKCLTVTEYSSHCVSVSNNYDKNCSDNFTLLYNKGHSKLLAGWFLICGVTIRANSTGGPVP